MKIEATVIETKDCGDSMEVSLQGKEPNAADWRGLERQTFRIGISERNARAFYIGRKVEIEIKPK